MRVKTVSEGLLKLTFAKLLLAFGSGVAALIYEIVWFQLLELVIGSTAVSLGILLATFMGGMCLGSLILRRLRLYAIELGIAICGILVLFLMPFVGSAWSAAACLLPPTLLMGATLPALARHEEVSGMGFLYGANIAGGVFGCLLSGFYLLRVYDVATATYVAVAINVAVALFAFLFVVSRDSSPARFSPAREGGGSSPIIYLAIALSGFCALAAEAIWTRILGLLLGASVYTLSIIVAVFLTGLGIGSAIGSMLCRSLARPRLALGCCQLLLAAAIAWTAYSLSASLPYWPIDPSISSNIWFNFQLDLARAFWALLPPTLLWGASFPLALAAAGSRNQDGSELFAGIYAANTLGAILGALGSEPAPGRLGRIAAHRAIAHRVVDGLRSVAATPALDYHGGAWSAWRFTVSHPFRKCSSPTAATPRPGSAKATSFTWAKA